MTDNLRFAAEAAWKVLAVGMVLGAGLPALFAVGVHSLAAGSADGSATHPAAAKPAARVLAGVCFGVVLVGIVLGLTIIFAAGQGKVVSFDHIYPTIVDKPE